MPDEAIAGFLGMMRASLADRRFDPGAPGAAKAAELAAWLSGAGFAAVVWSAGTLDTIAVETLTGLTTELNAVTRASAVPLGEAGEAQGAAEVSTWLAGYPLRIGFGRGEARHDPDLFSAARLLSSGECDLVVLVDARDGVSLGLPPAAGGLSVIRIGSWASGAPPGAGIAFDVAPAGAGSAGALWDERLSSFVSHAASIDSGRPSAAEVLLALGGALSREPAGRVA
jgi:formylmethanofuran dehydrogenase subunit B